MQGEPLSRTARLAVLIDADNAWASLVEPLLKEIAKYGSANVKRIYGDWTSPHLNTWKDKLNKFAIQPIQQFTYTSGKNSTDSALIIDAMDLLYTSNFDGFCIVSSDSDFTRLASRIRESGLRVYGFGEKKTPEAFQKSCDKFTYTEVLKDAEQKKLQMTETTIVKGEKASNKNTKKESDKIDLELNKNKKLLKLVKNAYDAIAKEDGWANLGELGGQLNKLSPSFDSKNYGYNQLGKLIRAIDIFEIKDTFYKNAQTVKALYIKLKI